ncbi:MAG: hypothetical protein H6932_17320 [Burkholderiaceae bacterium]|nr:hypothetical protein [Burkholderiaceae bacterium]
MAPTLVVIASSQACLSLAGHLFAIDGLELPHRGFSAWRAGCGAPPFYAQTDISLASIAWPEVLAIHTTMAAELLDMLSRVWPDTGFLFLVQDPETTLAYELPLPAGVDVGTWSERQLDVTRKVVRHLQRHPARSLCLLAHELPGAEEAAAELVQAHLGVSLDTPPNRLSLQRPPVLSQALARLLLEPEHRLRSATAELHATSAALAKETCSAGHIDLDLAQIVHEWNTLNERAAMAHDLQVRVASLAQQLAEHRDALSKSEQQRADMEIQLTRLGVEVDTVNRQPATLLASLERAGAAPDQAPRNEPALATEHARAAQPAVAVESSRKENEAINAAGAGAAPSHTGGPPAPAPDDVAAVLREKELLLVHLHQAQEELEQVFLERRSRAGRDGGNGSMPFGACEVQHARDTPPLLELELLLRDVQCGDQPTLDQLRLRLVDHNGNPGIVFFSDPRLPRQFLGSWVETGREGGFPYMLIVPSDSAGQALLRRLPTSDWNALLTLTNGLAGHLSATSDTGYTAWPAVARHLACQLAEQPPRLRYDELDVEVGERGYRIRFGRLAFGERRFQQLLLHWRPDDALPLALLAPEEEAVPAALDRWPRTGEGVRAGSFALPVGRLGPWTRLKHWARLTPMDCAILLSVLDALPAVIQVAQAGETISGGVADRLRADARRLLRQASAASGRREPLWRRLVARLRARSA